MKLERWNLLMEEFGFGENLSTFNKLIDYYGEKKRAYHNKTHIVDCLEKFDLVKTKLEHSKETELAIWFHDLIYNPYKKDNELKSAEECTQFLSTQNFNEESTKLIYDLIMATKHTSTPASNDEAYLMDIDITILGSNPNEYEKYCDYIRKEYALVPWMLYKRKRKEIMKNFLDRKFIYQTEFFRDKFESIARSNIRNEIRKLDGK